MDAESLATDHRAMLEMPELLRLALRAHCEAEYPHEACGLLLGRSLPGATTVERVVPARNLQRERPRDRYVLDPLDFIAADAEASAAGLEIVGIYHSHPDHPSEPSATDLAHAQQGWSYVIASVRGDGAAGLTCREQSWILRADGSAFCEEEIV